jgi:acyl carrier protein
MFVLGLEIVNWVVIRRSFSQSSKDWFCETGCFLCPKSEGAMKDKFVMLVFLCFSVITSTARADDVLSLRVHTIIANEMKIGPALVHDDMRLREDLGADDLALTDIIMQLENEFDCDMPMEAVDIANTVGDVILLLRTKCQPISRVPNWKP